MYQSENELKAIAESYAPRLKYFQPVILGGFTKGVPPKVKLWDLKPSIPDGLEPTQRKAKFHRNLSFLAKKFAANEEQVEATERSYSAPAGLSLTHGGSKTGKTATAVLQALTAISMGHKVILCAPTASYGDLEDLLRSHVAEMPEADTPKIYIANSPWFKDLHFKVIELVMADNDPKCSMPVCQRQGHCIRSADKVDHPKSCSLGSSSRRPSHFEFSGEASFIQRSPKLLSFSPNFI